MNLIHAEINNKLDKKTQSFYKVIFNWTIIESPAYENHYKLNCKEAGSSRFTASLIKNSNIKQAVVLTVEVDTINNSLLDKVLHYGGRLIGDRIILKEYGTFQYIEDPSGIVFCLKEGIDK